METWKDCETAQDRVNWVHSTYLDDSSYPATERSLKENIGEDSADEVPSSQSIRRYSQGKRDPSPEYVDLLYRATGVNPMWILWGRGHPDDPVGTHDRLRAMEVVARGREEDVAAMLAAISEDEGQEDLARILARVEELAEEGKTEEALKLLRDHRRDRTG